MQRHPRARSGGPADPAIVTRRQDLGTQYSPCHAVDQDRNALDSLLQARRDEIAATELRRRLPTALTSESRVVATGQLASGGIRRYLPPPPTIV